MFPSAATRAGRGAVGIRGLTPLVTILQLPANRAVTTGSFVPEVWTAAAVLRDDVGAWVPSNPDRVTAPSGCTQARMTAYSPWDSNGTGDRWINCYKNGAFFRGANYKPSNESRGSLVTPWMFGLPVGNYFQVEFAQTSGGNLNLRGSSTPNSDAAYFQIEWAP